MKNPVSMLQRLISKDIEEYSQRYFKEFAVTDVSANTVNSLVWMLQR